MDKVSKIREIKQRIMFPSRAYMYSDLLTFGAILHANEASGKKLEPLDLLKYYPVAIVSCFEGFFRMALAECIDHDTKYLENAKKLAEKNRIDFSLDVFMAIRDRMFSIGDMFAHSLRYGNPSEIFANCGQIIGKQFLTEVRGVDPKEIYSDRLDDDLVDFIDNFNDHYRNVLKAFEIRHIYCHEYMAGVFANEQETIAMLDSAHKFLRASDKYFRDLLYGNLTIGPGESLFTIFTDNYPRIKELDRTLESLKQKYPSKASQIDLNFAAWKKYKEEEHKMIAGLKAADGTSTQFVPRLTIDDVEDKIRELKKLL